MYAETARNHLSVVSTISSTSAKHPIQLPANFAWLFARICPHTPQEAVMCVQCGRLEYVGANPSNGHLILDRAIAF
jgi:hypothetical protein